MDTPELVCAVCKHSWEPRGDSPRRCPNLKCRSLRWRDGEDARSSVKIIPVRVTEDQFAQFGRAAKRAMKSISEWVRDIAVNAIAPPPTTILGAARPGSNVVVRAGYVEASLGAPVLMVGPENNHIGVRRKTAAEIADEARPLVEKEEKW